MQQNHPLHSSRPESVNLGIAFQPCMWVTCSKHTSRSQIKAKIAWPSGMSSWELENVVGKSTVQSFLVEEKWKLLIKSFPTQLVTFAFSNIVISNLCDSPHSKVVNRWTPSVYLELLPGFRIPHKRAWNQVCVEVIRQVSHYMGVIRLGCWGERGRHEVSKRSY